ncbi:MAG: hypothetical protein RR767_05500 [Acinetobacter sp.]
MSEYRDDALDSIRLSDSTQFITKSTNAIDIIRLSDSAQLTLNVKHHDQFSLSDSLSESSVLNAYDHLTLSNSITEQRIVTSATADQLTLSDSTWLHTLAAVEDEINLRDLAVSKIRSNSIDTIKLNESIIGQRIITVQVNDLFKLVDSATSVHAEQLIDGLLLGDFTESKLYGKSYAIDSFTLNGGDLSNVYLSSHAVDSVQLKDATQSKLTARNDSNDFISLYDQIKDSKLYGQAWTANRETWAMSRYMPYAFDGLTVINNQLYGWNAQGVFLMSTPSPGNSIHGFVQTGKLDFGESLVHPIASFLEYEMSGENKQLNIAVTTTQSGQPSTYTYVLPNEQADHLTNGRVMFGRGLRGRHFSFGISIAAQSAKINSLSLEFTKTARRI